MVFKQGFATVPLHPVPQPVIVDGKHTASFWTYLPQRVAGPVAASELAGPLGTLHSLPEPPVRLPRLDNIRAIRSSLASIHVLDDDELRFLAERADQLEAALGRVEFELPETLIQGDPQHRNALRDGDRTVLCDWDTIAWGRREWDLVTVEIHCRRFGYGREHYQGFADAYGSDVTAWPGYGVLRDIRELRMITTNARKALHTPGTLDEVRARIAGVRRGEPRTRWRIL